MTEILKGEIKWFSNKRGYGFIEGSDKKEYFVHYSKVISDSRVEFEEGDLVIFVPNETNKGLEARDVKKGA